MYRYVNLLTCKTEIYEPETYTQSNRCTEQGKFKQAIESKSLSENKARTL